MGNIRFRCPHCSRKLEVDPRGAGRKVPCPECGAPVDIPARAQTVRLVSKAGDDEPSTMWIRVARPLKPLRNAPGPVMWVLLATAAYVVFVWPVIRTYALFFLLCVFALAIGVLVKRKVLQGAGALLLAVALTIFVVVDMLLPKQAPLPRLERAVPRAAGTAPAEEGVVAVVGEDGQQEVPSAAASAKATQPGVSMPGATREEAPMFVASIPRTVPRMMTVTKSQAILNPEGPQTFPFRLYGDCDDGMFPYYPYGWMGNIDAIDLNECWEEDPHSGRTCMRFAYDAVGRWAGVAWQDPANNWGDMPGGYNLTGAKKLTFWVRGETGFERAEFKVGLLGVGKKYSDTAKRTLGKVQLYKEWHQYSISVEGMNMSRMVVAFLWVVEGGPRPVVFYIDDVQYE